MRNFWHHLHHYSFFHCWFLRYSHSIDYLLLMVIVRGHRFNKSRTTSWETLTSIVIEFENDNHSEIFVQKRRDSLRNDDEFNFFSRWLPLTVIVWNLESGKRWGWREEKVISADGLMLERKWVECLLFETRTKNWPKVCSWSRRLVTSIVETQL